MATSKRATSPFAPPRKLAPPKKVARKKLLKKTRRVLTSVVKNNIRNKLDQIIERARAAGFRLVGEDGNYTIEQLQGNEEYHFSFQKDQLVHCCGIIEIGETYFSNETNYDDDDDDNDQYTDPDDELNNLIDTNDDRLILLIQYAFLKEKNQLLQDSNPVRGQMLMYNGNGIENSAIIEDALDGLEAHFTQVAQIVNSNSGNTVSSYMGTYR